MSAERQVHITGAPLTLCPECGGKWVDGSVRTDEMMKALSELDPRRWVLVCENGHEMAGLNGSTAPTIERPFL